MQQILDCINKGELISARKLLMEWKEVDIAEFFDELDRKELMVLFRILPKDMAAEVFAYMENDQRQLIVEAITDEEVFDITENLFMDDAVDFLEEMPANVVKKVLNNTSSDRRKTINLLLSYPEDSAGSIMTTEFIDLKKEYTVEQAIKYIQKNGFDKETINVLYVMDAERRLEGILEIRMLLLSDPKTKIKDIMDTGYISIHTLDDQEYVAGLFKKYNYLSMPVVDTENRLVGIITVDDILDIIEEENEEDFAKMSALEPSDEEYLKTGIFSLARKRIVWLLILMVSATFTGIIIRSYEEVLSSVVILASFIPMLMDTGGNAGSQSSTLIIRGLALGELSSKDFFTILWKEFRVSLVVGLTLSLLNFAWLYFFEGVPLPVALTVCISLIFIVILSKVVGGMLPIIAKSMKLDPAIMAGPFVTTVVDTFALIVYFRMAMWLIL